MLTIRPRRALGVAVGVILLTLLLAGCAILVARIPSEPLTFTSFTAGVLAAVLFVLAACVGYWTYGCWSLRYLLDRNALTIAWAGNTYEIPLKDITALMPASEAPALGSAGGLWWPGYQVGRTSTAAGSFPATVMFFAAGHDPAALTYIVTPSRGYAISPPEPAEFAEELRLRAHLGPLVEVPQEVHRSLIWELPIWRDRIAWALFLLGLLANLALFAALTLAMPALPDTVPLHLNPLGLVDLEGPKIQLLAMPAAGLALLLTNTALGAWVYRVERLAGYLIIGWGVGSQALLWGAWLRLAA